MPQFEVTLEYPWTKWYRGHIIVEAESESAARLEALNDPDPDYGSFYAVGEGEGGDTEIVSVKQLSTTP